MSLYSKYMRAVLIFDIVVVLFLLTVLMYACSNNDSKQIANEIVYIPIVYAEPIKEENKIIEQFYENTNEENSYVYYKVYDFFYGTDKYHSLDSKLQKYTYDLCVEYEIEDYYTLILCQLFYESKYETDLISETDDYGIAQINKCNHKSLREKLGITDFLNAEQSIKCNIYLMSDYLKKYGVESALFCYNTGKPNGSNTYSKNIMYMWNNGVKEIKE